MLKQSAVAGIVVAMAGTGYSALISDSFKSGTSPAAGEYAADTVLDSANPTISGTTGAWGNPLDRLRTVTAGLSYTATLDGQSVTLGGSGSGAVQRMTSGNTSTQDYLRSLSTTSSTTVPGELWFGGLVTPGSTGASEVGRLYFALAGGTEGVLMMGVDAGSFVAVTDGPASAVTGTFTGATTASASTTYLFIGRLGISGVGTSTNESFKVWVNPTDISSESTLDSSSLATTTISDNVVFSSYRVSQFGFRVGGATNTGKSYDELLVGNSLSDIQSAFVPEPASLGLLGLAGMTILRRRRLK